MTRTTASILTLFATLAAPVHAAAPPSPAKREVGKAVLAQFRAAVEKGLRQTGVPGASVVIVHQDRVIFLEGFGIRKVGEKAKVDPDTIFQLASVSKPIASTVLAILVGEGLISWDDRMIRHLPGFRLSDPWVTGEVTLRDLLSHRSGLPSQAGDQLEDLGYSRTEILHRLRFLKPASSFRAGYAYTNFGFTAAAEAGARAVRKDWEDLSAGKLYRPLGMRSTSSRFADFARAKNRAALHVPEGKRMVAKYVRQPDAQSPAGGASSTARDLALWLRLQLAEGKFEGKTLVAPAALRQTHLPHSVSGSDPSTFGKVGFYGLGWGISYEEGHAFLKHSGAFDLGVRTQVALLPSERLGIAVLANACPTGLPEGLTATFFDLYLHGKATRDHVMENEKKIRAYFKKLAGSQRDYSRPPARPAPALPAARYAGKYRNDYFGDAEVVADGAKLTIRLGPKKRAFPLRHWDRDVFLYDDSKESYTGPAAVVFAVGPDGRAEQVRLESLDESPNAWFARVTGKR